LKNNNSQAVAIIHGGNEHTSIFGNVKFLQRGDCVLVTANIYDLPKNRTGFYGFHIHEGRDCFGKGFSNSGAHYNPHNNDHPNHAGDLPPLTLCGNNAHLEFLTDRFTVNEIIGRTVIIHSNPDDFNSQPSGNAGNKIACGAIKKI
jgi:Cu-Zn family superoxide dismutase